MGNSCKKSTLSLDNAKLETAVGSCGLGSCRSSCCEEKGENDTGMDAVHKEMEIASRVELALVHKIVTDAMIAGNRRLNVVREDIEGANEITITVRVGKK